MTTITISSTMLIPSAKSMRLKPSQVAIIWEIANAADSLRCMQRYKAGERFENGVWVEIPAKNLRPEDGRQDNHHTKKMLKELMGLTLEGEHKGEPWGAVLVAEYEFTQGGGLARIHVTRAGVQAICAPQTFAKIETEAKFRMKGSAKLLYAALADKKRQTKKPYAEIDLDEVRRICNVVERYPKWADFNRYVLKPTVQEINEFGTVSLTIKPLKKVRSVVKIRFDWEWKDLRQAVETDRENQRPKAERGKVQVANDAPPLTDEAKDKALEEQRRREAEIQNTNGATLRSYMQRNDLTFESWNLSHGGGTYSEFLTYVKNRMKAEGVEPLQIVK
jgi:hypothetical protein